MTQKDWSIGGCGLLTVLHSWPEASLGTFQGFPKIPSNAHGGKLEPISICRIEH